MTSNGRQPNASLISASCLSGYLSQFYTQEARSNLELEGLPIS